MSAASVIVPEIEPEFRGFPKIPRLFRDMVVTEKVDGTNACVIVTPYGVYAQSRNRMLKPGKSSDNHGFAGWVKDNQDALREVLGEGRHYGEWYGQGIQRGYGLNHKRLALFNTSRWDPVTIAEVLTDANACELELDVVPVLARWTFDTLMVQGELDDLARQGSEIAPGYMNPEGIVVYHAASQQLFKALLKNDEGHKGA